MRCARDFRRLTRVFREKRAKNTSRFRWVCTVAAYTVARAFSQKKSRGEQLVQTVPEAHQSIYIILSIYILSNLKYLKPDQPCRPLA